MRTQAWRYALALCVMAGSFFRFYHLDRQVFWYDEIHTQLWATGHSWAEVREQIPAVEMSAHELQSVLQLTPSRGPRQVIASILRDDPQHTPLYYLVAHGWMRMFGTSVWTLRSLSVLIGLLLLPCMYWLVGMLGVGARAPAIATMLVAISPFFVVYSQEARQYGLLALEVALSCGLLLRAIATGRMYAWVLYGISLVAGLYTHLLFAPMIMAHAVYMFVCFVWPRPREANGRTLLMPFLGTVSLAGVAIVPWALKVVASLSLVDRHLGWSNAVVSPFYLMAMWGFNYSALFLDTDRSVRFLQHVDAAVVLDYVFRGGVLAVIAWSLGFVARAVPRSSRVFLITLIVIPFLVLALPDLFLGGIRSGGGHRFLIPSYLGIMMAVACLLANGFNAVVSRRWRMRALLGAFLAAGVVSLTVHASAYTWWTKPVSYHLPRLARIVNQSPRPLVMAKASVNLISLSYLLPDSARVLPLQRVDTVHIPAGYSSVYVLEPSSALLTTLRATAGVRVTELDRKGKLWRILPGPGLP